MNNATDTTKKGLELVQEILKLVGGTFSATVFTNENFSVCDDILEITDSMKRPIYWIEMTDGEKYQNATFLKPGKLVPCKKFVLSVAEYDNGNRDTPPEVFDREIGTVYSEQAVVTLVLQTEAANIINGAMENANYTLFPESTF